MDAIATFDEQGPFARLLQQISIDALVHRDPRQRDEIALQFGEPGLGCVNRQQTRGTCLPVRKHLFDGNAAIHHPGLFRFAIVRLNLLQESLECGLVGGVSGEHFVGEKKPVRGDDQSDDDLGAVRAFIAIGTMAELVALVFRWWRFERGVGRVVEQDIELIAEDVMPWDGQMMEQRPFMGSTLSR